MGSVESAFEDGRKAIAGGSLCRPERLHDGLHCQGEHIVEQLGHQEVHQFGAVVRKGRVGVHLDHPQLEVLVHHVVHPKQLEIEGSFPFAFPLLRSQSREQSGVAGLDDVNTDPLHLFLEPGPDGIPSALAAILLVYELPEAEV